MLILKLLFSFLQIGVMSIGGGLSALPLIRHHIVEVNGWLTMNEFIDLITIAEMTPGPIAINAATFVGIRVAGIPGAIVATLGSVLPSFIIVIALAVLYSKYKNLNAVKSILKGLRPAVVALIASAGLTIFIMALWGVTSLKINIKSTNIFALSLFITGVAVMRKFRLNPIFIILGAGVIGMIFYTVFPEYASGL
ncbi:MAG: chromate transporter [Christensenellales bacterium]|jgi:chromate transporter